MTKRHYCARWGAHGFHDDGRERAILRDEPCTICKRARRRVRLETADGFKAWVDVEFVLPYGRFGGGAP